MSSIGKVFIVINLLLSLLFVGAGMALVAKGDNHRMEKEKLSADLDQARKDKETVEANLKAQNQTLQRDLDNTRQEKNRFSTEADSLRVAYDQEKQVNAQLRGDVDAIKADLANYATNNKSLHEEVSAVRAEKDKIRDAKDAAVTAQEKAEAEAKDAVAAMRKAQDELANVKDGAVQANKERDMLQNKLKRMQSMTGVSADQFQAQPQVDGEVVEISDDLDMVALTFDKDKAVEAGFTFDIYRGRTYLGQMSVQRVEGNIAYGKLTRRVPGTKIEKGDKATTKL